jgi:hypothetical protein
MATPLTLAIAAFLSASWCAQAQPIMAEMTLLTPDSLRIAGETLLVEVRINDTAGPIPGTYCFSGGPGTPEAKYADAVGSSTGQPQPGVYTTCGSSICDSGVVNQFLTGNSTVAQCFDNGVDTIKVVLYNSPRDRSTRLHQLTGELGSLPVSTAPFVLLPGPLSRLDLFADQAGTTVVPDTVTLAYPDGLQLVWAQGFDRFGNWRGPQDCTWATDGTLHQPTSSTTARVWYDASQVANNEVGNLRCTAISTAISSSILVRITGPATQILQALTLDTNGNGFLDGVRLRSAEKVDLSTMDSSALLAAISVENGANSWANMSIVGANGTLYDSVFVLSFAEDSIPRVPQTAWTPGISITGIPGLANVPLGTVMCVDGAPPVVWAVYNVIDPNGNIANDLIKVVLSEPIASRSGSLSLATPPESLFVVWVKQTDGTFTEQPGFFAGISALASVHDTSLGGVTLPMVVFRNSNDAGWQLLSNNYLNIRTSPSSVIRDQVMPPNVPLDNNLKVRVVPLGQMVEPPPLDEPHTSPQCGCGAGTETALLPPIFFSAGAWWRRRKKRRDAARA